MVGKDVYCILNKHPDTNELTYKLFTPKQTFYSNLKNCKYLGTFVVVKLK